jgi:hypothetical protein
VSRLRYFCHLSDSLLCVMKKYMLYVPTFVCTDTYMYRLTPILSLNIYFAVLAICYKKYTPSRLPSSTYILLYLRRAYVFEIPKIVSYDPKLCRTVRIEPLLCNCVARPRIRSYVQHKIRLLCRITQSGYFMCVSRHSWLDCCKKFGGCVSWEPR